jgi:hypothetical protein
VAGQQVRVVARPGPQGQDATAAGVEGHHRPPLIAQRGPGGPLDVGSHGEADVAGPVRFHEQVSDGADLLGRGTPRQFGVEGPLQPGGSELVVEVAGDVTEQVAFWEFALVFVAVIDGHRPGQHHPIGGGHVTAGSVERLVDGTGVAGPGVELVGPVHLDVVELDEQSTEQQHQECAQTADLFVHHRVAPAVVAPAVDEVLAPAPALALRPARVVAGLWSDTRMSSANKM